MEAARKSIVLLKNEKKLLPIDRSIIKRVAVIGPYADLFNQGNYGGVPKDPVTPLQGIKNAVGNNVEVLYCKGAQITPVKVRRGRPIPPRFDKEAEMKKAVEMARNSDVVFLFVGTTADIEVEGRDRKTLALPGNQNELIKAVYEVNKKVVVVLMSAGPVAVPEVKKNIPWLFYKLGGLEMREEMLLLMYFSEIIILEENFLIQCMRLMSRFPLRMNMISLRDSLICI